jgi:hypothetical protein
MVKWYMDCVTDIGDAAILYCADLHWRGMHLTYSNVLTMNGDSTETQSSMAGYRLSSTSGQIVAKFTDTNALCAHGSLHCVRKRTILSV